MLKTLRIQNFKCWQDTGEIRMAPLTLFFGTNSSGKSSIGQFLMMLKQTTEWSDRKTVLYPGESNSNSVVDLGSLPGMVFHHDLSNKIRFSYDWILPNNEKLEIEPSHKEEKYSGTELFFSAVIGSRGKNPPTPILETFNYVLGDHGCTSISIGMQRKNSQKTEYKVDAEPYHLVRKQGRAWSPGAPVKFYGFPDEVIAYYQNAGFVQEFNLRHEQLFRTISYLGPLRTKTERIYSWTGGEPGDVGYAGGNTIPALLAAKNRMLNLGNRKALKKFQALIAEKLREMGLIEAFKVNPISEQRHEYEVKVQTRGSKDFVDLPDVGFGVSQVLPVLVQCFYAQPESIIIMEQPEIHLHPSAQSALADVMIDAVHSKEGGRPRNIQLLIETHSEHFLRRLQRRIAEGAIDREKVSCYYADTTKSSAKLESLDVDLFGSIKNWPLNFFGDEMGDILAQSKAAMNKRGKENKRPEAAK